jgi:hypothetical protein
MCAEGPWFAPGYGRGDGLKLYCYIKAVVAGQTAAYSLSSTLGPGKKGISIEVNKGAI